MKCNWREWRMILGGLWLLLLGTAAGAQQILFRNYSVSDGLCSNTVWSIAQDKEGYMWFGTKHGLNRFDGYAFKSYQFRKDIPGSIGNNFIHAICRYDDKNFWIGTESGIYNLNLETERFTPVSIAGDDLVFDLLRDSKGTLWIATKSRGLYGYRSGDKKLVHFTANAGGGLSLNQVRNLEEDSRGRIWIGTFGEGVDMLDPATQQVAHYKATSTDAGTGINKIITLYKDLQGNMWAGSLGGLAVWYRDGGQAVFTNGAPGSISDNIVRAIYQPSPDKLYVGTEKGLNILDTRTQTFTAYTHKTNDPHSISDNAVYSIYPDREGGTWVGTFFGGLNYFSDKGSRFELYYATGENNTLSGNAVSCFLEDKPGTFWVGTENGGLNYFDAHAKTFRHYPFTASQQPLSYHNIHSLLRDDQQNLWIGTFSAGLNIYNPATGRVKKYQHDRLDTTSLSNNNIYALYKDRDGVIWVGTTEGLNVYDAKTDAFHRVRDRGLDKSLVYGIYEDHNGFIWFITYDLGLVGKNKKTGRWVQYMAGNQPNALSSNKLISLLDDQAGNLWIGTEGGGLNCLNLQTKKITVYNEPQGINPIVYGIQKDDNNNLWLSTNNGITRFSPQTGKTKVFTNLDNLQSPQFNYNASLKAADGKIYFGGINGFNAFYPDSLADAVTVSSPVITAFKLFNKDIAPGEENSPLKKLVGFVEKMTLSHDQSVISFEYSALSYLAPEKIQYAYLMEGFDKSWNNVGSQRKATYTNLPPGTYTFRVRATDIDGNWNGQTASVQIVVKPPFYRTTAAYLFYLLLLAAAVVAFRHYLLRRARKKNEARLERLNVQREKEFYNQKIEFFTTMAHEIRTPLSLIIAPLEKLLTAEEWKPEVREQLSIMDENSDRLLNLVNQLLDFRRIESDIYTIRTEELELISFIHSLYSRFSAISFQKGVKFSLATTINRLDVDADPEALTKILTNLLINAFKFTRSKVELRINDVTTGEDEKEYFSISVADDGMGIPADQLENIFKAFYKVNDNNQNVGGTGIGLALAKSLAEKHGGQLQVESREGVETIFTLLVPYRCPAGEATESKPEPAVADETEGKPAILVVEDDLSLQAFLAKSLRAENYKSLCAANGAEALRLLETHSVELILSDVMMPEMDGIAFCRQVKSNIQYSHIPLVLLTAKGNSDAEIAGIENGADAYITKPFKWKHLTVVMKNLLDSRAKLKSKFTQQPFADVATLTTNTQDKKFIEKLIAIIEERMTDSQLSVEELSREMAMSRSSLHKKLKAMSGHVPNEFIRLIRLKHAAKLLLGGEHNISEVGYLAGFNSPSYFSKCFLQQFGVTPSEFSEKQAAKPNHNLEDILG